MAIYSDHLTATFSALADPTRRAMLARLAQGPADVGELAKPFGLSQPTISRHLQVLERAGLVARGRDAQRRPRTLVTTRLREVDRWLEQYRRSWEERFASLDAFLDAAEPDGEGDERPRRKAKSARRTIRRKAR